MRVFRRNDLLTHMLTADDAAIEDHPLPMNAVANCQAGRAVWSWRPDAGAKFAAARAAAGDGGKKAGHRGEREVSRNTTAQGRPDCLR